MGRNILDIMSAACKAGVCSLPQGIAIASAVECFEDTAENRADLGNKPVEWILNLQSVDEEK